MQIGEVSFHDSKKVKKIKLNTKTNSERIHRLMKTKKEEFPDLVALKQEHVRELIEKQKLENKVKREKEAELRNLQEKKKELTSYATLFQEPSLRTSNKDMIDDDDFM
ncbi:hypothetical protein HMI54_012514 [Coelomomyces lativittatus]|nr:hypothetical protein HMI54_012514 [Coelomomyces lativittatus]